MQRTGPSCDPQAHLHTLQSRKFRLLRRDASLLHRPRALFLRSEKQDPRARQFITRFRGPHTFVRFGGNPTQGASPRASALGPEGEP
jgi:hypothetical protein